MSFKTFYQSIKENKQWNGNLPEKLYHASSFKNAKSIEKNGIIVCGKRKTFDWCENGIYLSCNAEIAGSFLTASENDELPDDFFDYIDVFEINTSDLDLLYLKKDSNSNMDGEEIQTCNFVYTKNINNFKLLKDTVLMNYNEKRPNFLNRNSKENSTKCHV